MGEPGTWYGLSVTCCDTSQEWEQVPGVVMRKSWHSTATTAEDLSASMDFAQAIGRDRKPATADNTYYEERHRHYCGVCHRTVTFRHSTWMVAAKELEKVSDIWIRHPELAVGDPWIAEWLEAEVSLAFFERFVQVVASQRRQARDAF